MVFKLNDLIRSMGNIGTIGGLHVEAIVAAVAVVLI